MLSGPLPTCRHSLYWLSGLAPRGRSEPAAKYVINAANQIAIPAFNFVRSLKGIRLIYHKVGEPVKSRFGQVDVHIDRSSS
jgi:hypothetical protein